MEETFGAYLRGKRQERDFTLREFAAKSEISPVYLSNLETGRKPAPAPEVLERFKTILRLGLWESDKLLDLAAKSHNKPSVPVDLPQYINERDIVRVALRTAKDVNATDKEWEEFIERITRRKANDEKEDGR
jgi:transcriptional regulator with XRE-family HTH domain